MIDYLKAFLTLPAPQPQPSPHTVRAYDSDLSQFIDHAAVAAGVKLRDLAPAALDRTPSGAFSRSARTWPVARDGGAQAGRGQNVPAIPAAGGMIDDDPGGVVATPKREVRMPAHSQRGRDAHLLAAPRQTMPLGRRDRAILELFYASGLRLSELAGLDLQDVNLAGKMVRVLGKGGKERLVPFNNNAAAADARLPEGSRDTRSRCAATRCSRRRAGGRAIRCL